jgi:hypothetical protein
VYGSLIKHCLKSCTCRDDNATVTRLRYGCILNGSAGWRSSQQVQYSCKPINALCGQTEVFLNVSLCMYTASFFCEREFRGKRIIPIVSRNSNNQLIVVTETRCVFFEVRTEFLNITRISFVRHTVKPLSRDEVSAHRNFEIFRNPPLVLAYRHTICQCIDF